MKNNVVLITGGAKGIGLATASLLSRDNLVIIIDNDENACQELKNSNEKIVVINKDISDYTEMSKTINNIFETYENIDVLINNAAIQSTCDMLLIDIDDWRKVIDINLNGTFIISQLVARRMKCGSKILNIISSHYNKPRRCRLHYDVSKAGVALMTKGFALELSEKRITVNALAIGATYTTMNEIFNIDKNVEKEALSKITMNKITSSDEIAHYIKTIICELADFSTGSIFTLDGGRHLL